MSRTIKTEMVNLECIPDGFPNLYDDKYWDGFTGRFQAWIYWADVAKFFENLLSEEKENSLKVDSQRGKPRMINKLYSRILCVLSGGHNWTEWYREENHIEKECMNCQHHEVMVNWLVGICVHNAPTFDEKYTSDYQKIPRLDSKMEES